MSGFEAILGVVSAGAGLLSLSIQLAESAKQLKSFCQSVQDAPKTLTTIAFDLETISLGLRRLERHRLDDSHDEDLLARCIERCRSSTAEVGAVIDKMSVYMAKSSRVGKIYTAIKEPEIRTLLVDLEHAKTSLQMAFMLYHAEEQDRRAQTQQLMLLMQNAQLDRIESNFLPPLTSSARSVTPVAFGTAPDTRYLSSDSDIVECDTASTQVEALPKSRAIRTRKARLRVKIALPLWMTNRVWDMSLAATEHGWDLGLRTYNIRDESAEIFRHCRTGNIQGAQKLLATKKASVLDTDQFGSTLLAYAASHSQLEFCQWPLKANIAWPDRNDVLTEALYCVGTSHWSEFKYPEALYRLIIEELHMSVEIDSDSGFFSLIWDRPYQTVNCFELLHRNLDPQCHTRGLQERFEITHENCDFVAGEESASVYLARIGLDQGDPRLASLKRADGETVLHRVAMEITPFSYEVDSWQRLGVAVLNNGGDPSAWRDGPPGIHGGTPLLGLLGHDGYRAISYSELNEWVENWTDVLRLADVNLCHYRACERRLWRQFAEYEDYLNIGCEISRSEITDAAGVQDSQSSTLKFRRIATVPTYHLQSMPGTFPSAKPCNTICWEPSLADEEDGPWELIDERRLRSRALDASTTLAMSPEPFRELVDGVQDDAGAVFLLEARASRAERPSRRSHSQPPPLIRPPSCNHVANMSATNHCWMGNYHYCFSHGKHVLTSRRGGFGSTRPFHDDIHQWSIDPRECVSGHLYGAQPGTLDRGGWLQDNYLDGFLRDVNDCQINDLVETPGVYGIGQYLDLLKHTASKDYPRGVLLY